MESWKDTFNFLGKILIVVAVIDLLVAMGMGTFTIESKYFDEISGGLVWAYLTHSTFPLICKGIVLIFVSDFISFLIDFYNKVCEIKVNTDTTTKNNNTNQ